MNKFTVAVAVVAVLVGCVALSSASHNHKTRPGSEEEFELEESELERPRHQSRDDEHAKSKTQVRGRRSENQKGKGPRPPPPPPPPHKKQHHKGQRPNRPCVCGNNGREGGEHGRGGFEEEDEGFSGDFNSEDRESGRFKFDDDVRVGGDEFRPHHRSEGRNGGAGNGGFSGAGVFGAVRKDKEFDAGVRGGSKKSNRNQFAKQNTIVGGEQKAVGAGVSHGESNSLEGVHQHKNHNNDRLVVKETQRGDEDLTGFRAQNNRNDEGHFGASDTKVFGAQNGESGSSDHESEKDFEGDVHKKNSFGAASGAGVVNGRF